MIYSPQPWYTKGKSIYDANGNVVGTFTEFSDMDLIIESVKSFEPMRRKIDELRTKIDELEEFVP